MGQQEPHHFVIISKTQPQCQLQLGFVTKITLHHHHPIITHPPSSSDLERLEGSVNQLNLRRLPQTILNNQLKLSHITALTLIAPGFWVLVIPRGGHKVPTLNLRALNCCLTLKLISSQTRVENSREHGEQAPRTPKVFPRNIQFKELS